MLKILMVCDPMFAPVYGPGTKKVALNYNVEPIAGVKW